MLSSSKIKAFIFDDCCGHGQNLFAFKMYCFGGRWEIGLIVKCGCEWLVGQVEIYTIHTSNQPTGSLGKIKSAAHGHFYPVSIFTIQLIPNVFVADGQIDVVLANQYVSAVREPVYFPNESATLHIFAFCIQTIGPIFKGTQLCQLLVCVPPRPLEDTFCILPSQRRARPNPPHIQ